MESFFLETSLPRILALLRRPSSQTIIFGAGVMGKAILEAADRHGIPITAFCDNNPRLHGSGIGGIEILPPQKAAADFPNAFFFIAVPRLFSIIPQLKSLGLAGRCLTIDILKESVTPGLPALPGYIATTIDGTAYEQKALDFDGVAGSHLSLLTLVITDHCTLNCRHCSHRIPYIARPRHRDRESLLKNLDAFLSCVDGVHTLSLSSADSLTHPKAAPLTREFLGRDKIHTVSVWTNAIIPFNAEQWRGFEKNTVSFHVTDYNHPRQKIAEFSAAAAEAGIRTHVSRREWTEIGILDRPASSEEASRMFQLCQLSMCITINNDRLYRCSMVPNAVAEGLMPDDDDNHIDLSKISDRNGERNRRDIHRFLFDKTSMSACAYCTGGRPGRRNTVEVAAQMPPITP